MDTAGIEKRLAEVEKRNQVLEQQVRRSNRWMRTMCGCFAAIVAVAFITGAVQQINDEFNFMDPNNGRIRIRIGTNPATGSAGVELCDKEGLRRLFIGLSDNDIPNITWYGKAGNAVKEIVP